MATLPRKFSGKGNTKLERDTPAAPPARGRTEQISMVWKRWAQRRSVHDFIRPAGCHLQVATTLLHTLHHNPSRYLPGTAPCRSGRPCSDASYRARVTSRFETLSASTFSSSLGRLPHAQRPARAGDGQIRGMARKCAVVYARMVVAHERKLVNGDGTGTLK